MMREIKVKFSFTLPFLFACQLKSTVLLLGGWEPSVPLKFYIKHSPNNSLIHVRGWENGTLKFDDEILDNASSTLNKGGKIGAFVHSQRDVRWSNLSYRLHIIILWHFDHIYILDAIIKQLPPSLLCQCVPQLSVNR